MTEAHRTPSRSAEAPSAPALREEGAAIVAGAAGFVLTALVALPSFWGRTLPIAGPGSISQFTAIAAGVLAIVAYPVGRLWRREGLTPFGSRRPGGPRPRTSGADVFDTVVIAFAHGAIALLLWIALGAVLADAFQGALVYFLAAVVLAAAVTGVTAYAVFLSGAGMDILRLSTVLAVFAVVGILTAMLSAPDPDWWRLHLSALGMTSSVSSLTFNLTLIVTGVIVTAIARYATDLRDVDDPRRRHGLVRVRVCLLLTGILLAGVGVFPLNVSQILHNVSAVGMVLVFALLVFWVRAALPQAPPAFFVLGYVFFATIVGVLVFFVVGYYVLTAAELVAGVLVFSWLIVYLRVSGAAQAGGGTEP
ncbi:DUF998 domain-containing protein [Leifsonia aquatica]|uniref:DUF998 domain-containing protein n=1 Tax=Leifsonia aquatica TaxID=144185 RepID=UPI0028A7A514|nr:DUF998 domain-containing protein [Leifsonia aquatica]